MYIQNNYDPKEVKQSQNKHIIKGSNGMPGKTSMLIDFCSLYLNKDQIWLNNKKYNKELFSYLPDVNNKDVNGRRINLAQNRNKLKITFNKQNTIAHNYLNSTVRRKSNNLTKLHEFEKNLLLNEIQSKCKKF